MDAQGVRGQDKIQGGGPHNTMLAGIGRKSLPALSLALSPLFPRHNTCSAFHLVSPAGGRIASSQFASSFRTQSALAMSDSSPPVISGRPTWQQTMIRIADPAKSLPFYTDVLGMTLIDQFDFPQWNFSLYFVATLPIGTKFDLTPGTKAAHDHLWTYEGVAIELTHNHGTQSDDSFKGYHPGNAEKDGFGHIAVSCDDVYEKCSELEAAGVRFKKKPDEGRMKGLAFAFDPDTYWVEIVKRRTAGKIKNGYNFSQTMLRVKDPKKSIEYYKRLGMTVVSERHFPDNNFSLYFLASNVPDDFPSDPTSEEAITEASNLFQPILELTHNHGTEDDADFKHNNGNEEGKEGFGHIGFLVDDVYKACDDIETMGYGFKKTPDGGSMKGLAFAWDPDGYSVEIIKRGGIEYGDKKADE